MSDQYWKNEYPEQQDPWDRGTYQTGSTQPPKRRGVLIAILLVLVIFLCGIVSALSLLNIRLFREITSDAAIAPASVQFSGKTRAAIGAPGLPALGLTGKEISAFEQQCYEIPKGFYITAV